jgi:hypothetical protein
MTVGAALLLIAVGAILRFAVQTVSTHGFNVHTIGDILMLIGVLGLVLWMLVWSPWAPRRRTRVVAPPRNVERTVQRTTVERTPDAYPDGRYPDGRYPDGRAPAPADPAIDDYRTLPLDERDGRYR